MPKGRPTTADRLGHRARVIATRELVAACRPEYQLLYVARLDALRAETGRDPNALHNQARAAAIRDLTGIHEDDYRARHATELDRLHRMTDREGVGEYLATAEREVAR